MKNLLVCAFVVMLSACATEIRKSAWGGQHFEVRQHFLNGSEQEAWAMAKIRCASTNSTPKLWSLDKGGFLKRGNGEFNIYTFECISNRAIAENQQKNDAQTCSGWGFQAGTDGFASCMLRMYEVRVAVENAAAKNEEIRNLSEQQRIAAEQAQVLRLLNLNMQIQQQYQTPSITPFTCNRVGNIVNCF